MTYLEHAEDIFGKWLTWKAECGVALVIVTNTDGGAVRAPGAMMAVSKAGEQAGYISGGCIDADVVLQAQRAIKSGKPQLLRYGAGSPFIDLPLPCGGTIEVVILPHADTELVRTCRCQLAARRPLTLSLSTSGGLSFGSSEAQDDLTFRYMPKLRLRIAGHGAEGFALARLAMASGVETWLQLRDGDDMDESRRLGFGNVTALTTPANLPPLEDDPWTAFLLAFHNIDWEESLLAQALSGPAFYIGAVGSRRTHARRYDQLRRAGFGEDQVRRIHGPVGMIPSMRDASTLAISVLAEIVEAFHHQAFSSNRVRASHIYSESPKCSGRKLING